MFVAIQQKLQMGTPIRHDEALWLLTEADLLQLGRLADGVRKKKHPHNRVTFVIDRNVNYTNVCTSGCRFCAFYREPGAPDGYVLDDETILAKVGELVAHGGTQLLMQGGLHPELKIDWFEQIFARIRARFPGVQIHSLSPAEVLQIAANSGLSMEETLRRLQQAGLASVPGGGAEVLVDSVRQTISPKKIATRDWLAVMEAAHRLGMRTTATMMFGSTETPEHIVEHLLIIRDLQEKTGGFTAFIPWSYQPGNTELGGESAGGVAYLRVLATARIVLDNIANLQASWVTQGAMMAQVALLFGANDLGGTMLEENVVAAAGCSFRLSIPEIVEIARGAGFVPAKRNTLYEILETY